MNPVQISRIPDTFIDLISIVRPEALNAINHDVMNGLSNYFVNKQYTKDIQGVIITGSGQKSFIAGADITQFVGIEADDAIALSKFGHRVFDAIASFHVPVIAAVNGYALGGGCELAMACHLRVASENARFGQPEVNLGLIPGYGGTQRLVDLIGKGRAMEMLLTGEAIKSDVALQFGLVNHVVSSEELLDKCVALLTVISQKGPAAVAKTLEILHYSKRIDEDYASEYNSFGILMADDECQEGVDAFLNKRKAEFRK